MKCKSFLIGVLAMLLGLNIMAQNSGSPCPDNIDPFCTEDNDFGTAYTSHTGISSAASFLGSSSYSCLTTTPNPCWYYMQIQDPGNLLIYIEQRTGINPTTHVPTGSTLDIDFACWGPFTATDRADFITNLCNGNYTLTNAGSTHRPSNGNHNGNVGGFPIGTAIDCSYDGSGTEWCFIPNAQPGQWYLLLVCNYSGSPGYFSFTSQSTSSYPGGQQATTNCNLLNSGDSNSPICEGATLELWTTDPHPGVTYNWHSPTGQTYSTQETMLSIPNATAEMTGEWTMTLSNASQQSNAAIIEVVVYPAPVPEIVCDHEHVCQGDSIHISAVDYDPLATYIWSGKPINSTQDYELVAMNTPEFDYQPESSTRFVLVAMANDCMGVDSFDVAVTPNPNININITKPFICFGDNTSITATGGSYYRWSGGSTSTSASINVSPTMTTDYTVEVTTDAGCKDDTTVTITVNPEITLSYEQYPSYCGLPTGEITMATLGGTPPYTYNSTQVNFVDNIASGLNSGSYGVTMIDAEGCTKSMTAEVGLVPGPEACFIFTSSDDVQMAVANCTPGGTNNNYFWDFGDAVTSTEFNPTHEYPEPGRYSVFMQVEDEHGCIDSLRQDYLINGPVYFPNAFTPNGDGVNDEIGVIGRTIQEEDFLWVVYSRNGQMVFISTNPTLLWDGNMPNGQKAPSGVYVYSLKYKDVNGNHFERDGSFTLIR